MTEYSKEQWLKDLRSGEFKQCRGMIAQDGTGTIPISFDAAVAFCCLGVLAQQQSSSGYPDQRWLKRERLDSFTLARMNDYERLSFDKIADYIEGRTNAVS